MPILISPYRFDIVIKYARLELGRDLAKSRHFSVQYP